MNLLWAAFGAAAGLFAGAVLRGVLPRLSADPGGLPPPGCPHCAEPLPPWLWLRCACCGRRRCVPPVLELTTAAVLALLGARFAGHVALAAFAFLGVLGVALAAVDLGSQRLPNRLTLPAYPVLLALLFSAALATGRFGALGRAALGGLVLGGCYLCVALARPSGLGGGDVKLAGLLGIALGWLGWPVLLLGAALAFVLFAVLGLALLAAGRIGLRSAVSFGPHMLTGALLAALAAG